MEFCYRHRGLDFKIESLTWKQLYYRKLKYRFCPHINRCQLRSRFGRILSNLRFSNEKIPRLAEQLDVALMQTKNVTCQGKGCTFGKNHLWMCAEEDCYFIGCGRRDNVHMMNHVKHERNEPETIEALTDRHAPKVITYNHPITIKLTTMEIYCYQCSAWVGGTLPWNPMCC